MRGKTALNFNKSVILYVMENLSARPIPIASMGTKKTELNFFLASSNSLRLLPLFSLLIMHRFIPLFLFAKNIHPSDTLISEFVLKKVIVLGRLLG